MPGRQALAAFRDRFRGQVVLPGDPGYDRARPAVPATAFSGRSAALWLITEAVWDDPAEDPARTAWGRQAMAALRPFATSVNYVNDLGQLDQDAVRAAYGPATYDRLVALKRAWDPANVLRRNQNIRP